MANADQGSDETSPTRDAARGRRAESSAEGVKEGVVEGIVVALAPGFFEVAVGTQTYLCTIRGRLRTSRPAPATLGAHRAPSAGQRPPRSAPPAGAPAARIAPGERVLVTALSATEGVIEEVLPRRTLLARARPEVGGEHALMANLDQALLVFATRQPAPNLRLLDRYLAMCEHAGIAAVLCLNKLDLGIPPDVEAAAALYHSLGYPLLFTSATTAAGLDTLRARLAGRVSLLSGPSGVGKSSLMNALLPEAQQRIGEISEATGKGRHTTTGVRLLPVAGGGWLADSAGIRELALWNVPAAELPRCFVELRPFAESCLYEDCRHSVGEEGCALREALAAGSIAPSRFASFERLLEDTLAAEPPRWAPQPR